MSLKKESKNPFVRIYNFIQREFAYSTQIDHQGGHLPYGVNDNFPNKLLDLVEGSPTATACLSTYADFVIGEGFNLGADIENRILNSQGLTFSKYHSIQADSLVYNWGMASIVKYNPVGQITEIFDIPFHYCRLGRPDDNGVISKIHYNPYFGTSLYRSQDTVVYDVYNPKAAVLQIARDGKKYKGQINWFGIRDRKHPFYPIPDYYTAKTWMNAEKNAGVYFDENLENGFLTPTVLKMLGDPNDPSGVKTPEGDDIPKGEILDKELTSKFSGAKRVGQLMVMWASNKEEFPELTEFPTNANADMHRVTDEHATKKITIATKVPAILANISEGVSLGGDGNTIRAAVKLMQQRAKRFQNILLDYYQEMFMHMTKPMVETLTIVPYNPFPELESVDPQIWEVMTPEEKRKWVKDHTEIELIDEMPEPQPAPTPVQNRIMNFHFNSYPKKAKENVQRAIEWHDKMSATCIKPKGRELSEKILNGVPLGPQEIKRLSRYLSKQTVYASLPFNESCDAVLYHAWGGSEMMIWANEKIKELNGKAD